MKILHVTPYFSPSRYGGIPETAYQLSRHLAELGCTVRVLTTNANSPKETLDVDVRQEIMVHHRLSVRYFPRRFSSAVAPTLLRELWSSIRWADVVHLTAVYSFPTIPILALAAALDTPVIWSPRGALQRWEGTTRRRLKTAWELVCRAIRPRRLLLHATSDEEARDSRERFPGVPVAVIPNGVDLPLYVRHVDADNALRFLALSRIDPKKGLGNLVAACALFRKVARTCWSLTIAGAGTPEHVAALERQIAELNLSPHIRLLGHVAGEQKEETLAGADVVIVPSHGESFGMTAAEALARGIPVIVGRGAPWRAVEEVGCGLWVENDPESLARALASVQTLPLREMGERGRTWMAASFRWRDRATEFLRACEDLCGSQRDLSPTARQERAPQVQ